MQFKSCPATVKAAGEADGLEDGQFEAIVSVFGNVDAYGDVVMPGAFTDTLAAWQTSGNSIPVYYSHRMDDPDYNIGAVLDAKEVEEGLWVKAQLRLDATTSKAPQVHRLLKDRTLSQFSFAYDVVEGGMEKRESDTGDEPEEFYALRKLRLYEVGPTPIGANQETELLGVKTIPLGTHALDHWTRTIAAKAGRVISAKNEKALREALEGLNTSSDQIKNVLAALESPDDEDDEKAAHDAPAKDEDPQGKSEEPNRPSPADLSALQSIELAAL